MENLLLLIVSLSLSLFIGWVFGGKIAKHYIFLVFAVFISFYMTPNFFEKKTIPFHLNNLCDQTYYKQVKTDKSNVSINKKGQAELNLDETIDRFSQYVDLNTYENNSLGKIHWSYGYFASCLSYIEDEVGDNIFYKTGKFPKSCSEYSQCGGGFSSIPTKEDQNPFLYTNSDYDLKSKFIPNLDQKTIQKIDVIMASSIFYIIILSFYIFFVFISRKFSKFINDESI